MKTAVVEQPEKLRQKVDYDFHATNKLMSVKEACVWHELFNFHVYDN